MRTRSKETSWLKNLRESFGKDLVSVSLLHPEALKFKRAIIVINHSCGADNDI